MFFHNMLPGGFMFSVNEIIDEVVARLGALPVGTEASTSDLIYLVCDCNEEISNAVDMSLDDLFMIDEQVRKRAIKQGFYLDGSMFEDAIGALPFDKRFVIRKL